MMPMMGPPPHGMMPGGPGKKRIFLTKLQLMLMCLIVLSQPGCVRQIHFIQTRQANKAVSFTSIRSAFSKAYYWSQRVSSMIFFIFYCPTFLFPFLRVSSKNIPDNRRPLEHQFSLLVLWQSRSPLSREDSRFWDDFIFPV